MSFWLTNITDRSSYGDPYEMAIRLYIKSLGHGPYDFVQDPVTAEVPRRLKDTESWQAARSIPKRTLGTLPFLS